MDKFQAAFDALPESADGEDIHSFIATVAVSYMPAREAMRMLADVIVSVNKFAETETPVDISDVDICPCPTCSERRAIRH
jgi:hypothetical protein